MKVLILHLSDAHISNRNDVNREKISKLINSLNPLKGFKDCLIIFSGDIANSGKVNEYKLAGHFLGSLVTGIKDKFLLNKFIKILVVPGNHDIDFTNIKRGRKDIIQLYSEKKIDREIDNEVKLLEAFRAFSKINKCFLSDAVFDRKNISFEKFKIQVNLINTAIFSTLKDDKGIHYLPIRYIEELSQKSNADLAITVMHHSHEWFAEKTKILLEKVLYESTSILFLGHEHNPSSKELTFNNIEKINIIAGGIFGGNTQRSEFNAIILDTEKSKIETYSFNWETKGNIYKHKKVNENNVFYKKSLSKSLFPVDEFLEALKKDEKHKVSENFTDYFVFPRLTANNSEEYSDNIEICDIKIFLEKLELRKRIIIEGNENAGKTVLLKRIYLSLLKTKTPLLFIVEDIKNKRSDKVIKFVFQEQYGENEIDYIKFQQLDSSSKVAIIDDADKLRKESLEGLIDVLEKEFDYIIISSRRKWDFNIIKSAKKSLNSEEEYFKYKLNGFYSDKREELIGNICLAKSANKSEDISRTVKKINGFIKNQFHLFRIDPDFIIQYVEYFYDSASTFDNANSNVFNKVFENNIVNFIRKCDKRGNVDEIFIVMEEISYFIHFNKKYPINITDFEKIINEYNYEYDQGIKAKELYDIAIEAKILKEVGNSFEIKFCNNNYLAFFTARRLNRKFNENNDSNDLRYVLNNICFGINGDIVLFLSYITSNIQILNSIYQASEKYMSLWEEFNLDDGNIRFLSHFSTNVEVKAPSATDKEKLAEMETKAEQAVYSDEVLEAMDIYDYDEKEAETFKYKILKALNYTEMLAKALPNFYHMLPRVLKENFVKNMYTSPNKILNYILSDIDDNFDSIVDEILEYYNNQNRSESNKKVKTKQDVTILLINISISLILGLYDYIANISTNDRTIQTLNKFPYSGNINYEIQNVIMEENAENTPVFIKKIDKLYDKNDKLVELMTKQIVRKCLLCHDNIKLSDKHHLEEKYFKNKKERKSLLLNKMSLKRIN